MSGRTASDAKTANVADAPRIAAPALAAFIKRAFEAVGLRSDDAKVVADLMVEADLRGSDTHGVIRLPLCHLDRGSITTGISSPQRSSREIGAIQASSPALRRGAAGTQSSLDIVL